jgi:hypothetical protein
MVGSGLFHCGAESTESGGWKVFPIRRGEDSRAAAAKARALLLAIEKPCLAQQLVPFRLIVERNFEQAAPPVRTGRGASLRQESQQGSDARSSSHDCP